MNTTPLDHIQNDTPLFESDDQDINDLYIGLQNIDNEPIGGTQLTLEQLQQMTDQHIADDTLHTNHSNIDSEPLQIQDFTQPLLVENYNNEPVLGNEYTAVQFNTFTGTPKFSVEQLSQLDDRTSMLLDSSQLGKSSSHEMVCQLGEQNITLNQYNDIPPTNINQGGRSGSDLPSISSNHLTDIGSLHAILETENNELNLNTTLVDMKSSENIPTVKKSIKKQVSLMINFLNASCSED